MSRTSEVAIVILVAACAVGRLLYQGRGVGFFRKRR